MKESYNNSMNHIKVGERHHSTSDFKEMYKRGSRLLRDDVNKFKDNYEDLFDVCLSYATDNEQDALTGFTRQEIEDSKILGNQINYNLPELYNEDFSKHLDWDKEQILKTLNSLVIIAGTTAETFRRKLEEAIKLCAADKTISDNARQALNQLNSCDEILKECVVNINEDYSLISGKSFAHQTLIRM